MIKNQLVVRLSVFVSYVSSHKDMPVIKGIAETVVVRSTEMHIIIIQHKTKCFMYIFYWYALTPNSIGGPPASYAPISGAAPVIDTVKD